MGTDMHACTGLAQWEGAAVPWLLDVAVVACLILVRGLQTTFSLRC